MPCRKEIASLQDMCLQNVAENVMYHSERFRKSVDNECFYKYYILQRLYGDKLLEKMCSFHSELCKRTNGADTRSCPADLLFRDGRSHGSESLKNCWDFIFNKYLQEVSPMCSSCTKKGIPAEIVSRILSNCREPKYLNLSMCHYEEAQFIEALPHWSKLVVLDLSHSPCTDKIMIGIWNSLLSLQRLYLDSCTNITDQCLFHLCKFSSESRESSICIRNGFCSTLGENLETLSVNRTKISKFGILCALVHLQNLQSLSHNLSGENPVASAVVASVEQLERYCGSTLRFPLKHIELNSRTSLSRMMIVKIFTFYPQLNELSLSATAKSLEILTRWPSRPINSMTLRLSSRTLGSVAFKKFLLKRGKELLKLKVNVGTAGRFRIRYVVDILKQCQNLRELSIDGILYNYDDLINVVRDIPARLQNLEVLELSVVLGGGSERFLEEIMKRTVNLKTIIVKGCWVALGVLVPALKRNSFNSLENIIINDADIRHLSLIPFVNSQNNLKKIVLRICRNKGAFLKKHKEIAWRNNFSLDIECHIDGHMETD